MSPTFALSAVWNLEMADQLVSDRGRFHKTHNAVLAEGIEHSIGVGERYGYALIHIFYPAGLPVQTSQRLVVDDARAVEIVIDQDDSTVMIFQLLGTPHFFE
jgi:hypothetical protein